MKLYIGNIEIKYTNYLGGINIPNSNFQMTTLLPAGYTNFQVRDCLNEAGTFNVRIDNTYVNQYSLGIGDVFLYDYIAPPISAFKWIILNTAETYTLTFVPYGLTSC